MNYGITCKESCLSWRENYLKFPCSPNIVTYIAPGLQQVLSKERRHTFQSKTVGKYN